MSECAFSRNILLNRLSVLSILEEWLELKQILEEGAFQKEKRKKKKSTEVQSLFEENESGQSSLYFFFFFNLTSWQLCIVRGWLPFFWQ